MKAKDYARLVADLIDLHLESAATQQAQSLLDPELGDSPLDYPAVLRQTSTSPYTLNHEQQVMLALGVIFDRQVTSMIDLNAGGVVQYLTPQLAKGMTIAYHTAYDTFGIVALKDPATAGWA